jgi:hypothetical protein
VQNPVIVVPGIQGSGLEDFYPIPSEEVWSAIEHKEFERISLHPDDLRYEAQEPADVRPRGPFAVAYKDLVEALRHDLTDKKDKPTPVFPFGHDWRQDCAKSADQLAVFIDQVLARTWLLPHYRKEKDRRVDLVGHSMGGLIIADYLSRFGGKKVRRVVSIGTPFEGSLEAPKKLTTGLGAFTDDPPRDRERETARTIPALYQLIPTFPGAVKSSAGLPTDLAKIANWQPSILRTLTEFIRVQGAAVSPPALFQSYLDGLGRLRQSVAKLKGKLPVEWLAIVGIGSKTQLEMDIILWPPKGRQEPSFDVPAEVDDYPGANTGMTGDGTVPFPGACPAFLPKDQLLCVTPDDFSFWEIRDRALAKIAGFHSFLANVNLVQRLTIKFLKPSFTGDVWGHPAPGIAKPQWPSWLKAEVKVP